MLILAAIVIVIAAIAASRIWRYVLGVTETMAATEPATPPKVQVSRSMFFRRLMAIIICTIIAMIIATQK